IRTGQRSDQVLTKCSSGDVIPRWPTFGEIEARHKRYKWCSRAIKVRRSEVGMRATSSVRPGLTASNIPFGSAICTILGFVMPNWASGEARFSVLRANRVVNLLTGAQQEAFRKYLQPRRRAGCKLRPIAQQTKR